MAKTIGFIGGTGPEGKGLASRFAAAGLEVYLGSRSAERGEEAAREVASASGGKVRGVTNAVAADKGEVVILTLPYEGLKETLAGLEAALVDKVVISTIVPLQFSGGRAGLLQTQIGSAAEDAQMLLPQALVVGAFQNLAARKLFDLAKPMEGDVIVCSDHPSALREVMELSESIKALRGVNGGPLTASRYVEGLTALQVGINRFYRVETGVRIVGI